MEGGNLEIQNNLGYCYQSRIGIVKMKKKQFKGNLI